MCNHQMKMYRIAVANIIVVCMSLLIFYLFWLLLSLSLSLFLFLKCFVYRLSWSVYVMLCVSIFVCIRVNVNFATLFSSLFQNNKFSHSIPFSVTLSIGQWGVWYFGPYYTCASICTYPQQIIIIINILTSNAAVHILLFCIYISNPLLHANTYVTIKHDTVQ